MYIKNVFLYLFLPYNSPFLNFNFDFNLTMTSMNSVISIDFYNKKERETLKLEVINYVEKLKKNPCEDKIVLTCVKVLVKTLANDKSFYHLRLDRYSQNRLDKYGKWILMKKLRGRIYFRLNI